MLTLTLPYPPSVNSYWGFRGSHRYLTAKAKIFKQEVWIEYVKSKYKDFGKNRLEINITLNPPDRRIRDLDNSIKSLLDALCQAGVFDDDNQIDKLTVQRGGIIKGGSCNIFIQQIALQV
jgi:crossover junction endodeoxyribonuclease RusA